MTTILEFFSDLMEAYEARDYARGLRIAREAHAHLPGQHAKTFFWMSCMYSLLDRHADAVEALKEGLAEGIWWGLKTLDTEHDLDPVRGNLGFQEVRAECEIRYRRAQENARPECLTLEPGSGRYPVGLLLVIHWRGDSALEFASHWSFLADERGWTLLVPQSSQPLDAGTFCWDDTERGRREIRAHLDAYRRGRTGGPDLLVVAGASQGARLAFEVAQEEGAPYVSVIPSFPKDYRPSPGEARGGFTRGAFLLGSLDAANERTHPVVRDLKARGAEVSVHVMEGIGHDFPPDFPDRIERILAALRSR